MIIQPVFVVMPLTDAAHLERVFEKGIVPALDRWGFAAKRIDDQVPSVAIADAIRQQIKDSYFVIADLSFGRPNCYYEVGYADALRKPVLLLKRSDHETHFNLSQQMVHSFSATDSIDNLLTRIVPKFLETRPRDREDDRNGEFGRRCLCDGFRLSARVLSCKRNRCLLDFEVSAMAGERTLEGAVKFYMHHSYTKKVQQVQAKDGVARYQDVTSDDGPWTLGAQVLTTGTRLELDLATIPGAKGWWYREAYELASRP